MIALRIASSRLNSKIPETSAVSDPAADGLLSRAWPCAKDSPASPTSKASNMTTDLIISPQIYPGHHQCSLPRTRNHTNPRDEHRASPQPARRRAAKWRDGTSQHQTHQEAHCAPPRRDRYDSRDDDEHCQMKHTRTNRRSYNNRNDIQVHCDDRRYHVKQTHEHSCRQPPCSHVD